MKLSFIKPLHAAWMIEAINSMSEDKQLVKQCWEAVGIQHPFCSILQTCAAPVHEFDPARLGITVNTVPSFGIEILARRMLGNQVKPDQEFNVISILHSTLLKESWRGSSLSGIGKQMDHLRQLLMCHQVGQYMYIF